ncbi:heterochromatin protein 1-binding protein 3 isoform X2 [Halichoeres trimaculatus]|uniref:heterochromatin protein 1-binding protein 3 isoform X2 n=1 Tax=Halichoeres trimaculatus TaxID=147232 RepID=UPI003D9EAF9B
MPIRRAPATPTGEKVPSAAAEKDPEASSEESPSADEEPAASSAATEDVEEANNAADTEPAENGEKTEEAETAAEKKDGEAGEKKELKDGYKYKKSKSKKVKRTIPAWASVTASKKVPVTNFAGNQNKVDNILIEAISSCNDRSGVSFQSVMKYMLKKYPGMELDRKKFLIKKAMKKLVEKGTIKQLKGKGLSGTFAIGKKVPETKKTAQKLGESLGDALPLIITRLCEPKEASYNLIKKYLEQHFPSLNIENRPDVLKAALVRAVEKGQLEQITGKGARGTFQLKRTGNQVLLKGGAVEDAITAAITAMNEPKTCSTTTLKKYLVDSNKDRKEYQLVASLRRTLSKCKVLGWMEQITGHGFTGTYQLSFPYYPSPTILYPEKFKEQPKKNSQPAAKRRRTADSSDEEEEEEEEEEESEDEAPAPKRKAQKRPPPKARRPPPAKKSRSASPSKAKSRGRPLAKKSPAKKAVSSGKKKGRKPPPAKKESTTAPKATPVKRGAPAKKPKTPAVKKLAKRGSKRPSYRESSPDEEEEEVPKETTKSKRSKPEENEEPAAKKPATKGGRRSAPEEPASKSPAKKGAKSKQSGRKSKRGK